ncbi:MAG: ABC transporter permease [Bryobacteraceae bacterium]
MWNDLRYAFRTLARERGFAAMAVLSLAVGIGANTAIFSVVNGVLLRPLAYREPQRLVAIREVVPKLVHLYPSLPVNLNHYFEWRKHCAALESVAVVRTSTFNLTGTGEPELLNGALVSANIFHVLGVNPRLGRAFLDEEDPEGHDRVVVISDSLWRRRFGADPSLVGRNILLGGRPHLVVGILAPDFRFFVQTGLGFDGLGPKTEIFRPLGYSKDDLEDWEGDFNWAGIARLRPGVSPQQAIAQLNAIQAQIGTHLTEKMDLHVALASLQEDIVGPARRGLLVLLSAVGAVLLILCANLANLSLARAAGRARESAIRTALGAGRLQLMWQTLTESLLLALVGGTLGIALAVWGVRVLLKTAPVDLPRVDEVSVDWRVLSFALLISLVTGVVFGILPALRSAGAHPQEALKSGGYTNTEGRRSVRLRDVLVGVEAALSAMLLIAAGLLLGSFVRLMHVDKGFNIERVLAVDLAMPATKYKEQAQQAAFFERVLEKARALPGVESAGFVSTLPLQGETWIDMASAEGDQRPLWERPMVNVRFVSPDYFKTLRIAFREGASFDDSQRNRKVVIVSQGLARRLWAGQAVGRRMQQNNWLEEVVGVTADIRSTSLDKDPVLIIYIPYWQRVGRLSSSLLIRTAMDPHGIATATREAIRQVDGDVPVPQMRTMQEVMASSVAQRRFQMMLVALFACAALALAGFGIYGVVSYSVARRRTEMGIRMALGAGAAGLQRMVLWQGIRPVAAGLAAGIVMALAAGRALSSLLFEMSARDPLTIGGVALVLLLVAAAAALVPARRATRVDPLTALRFE